LDDSTYGFADDPRRVQPTTDLYWLYAGLARNLPLKNAPGSGRCELGGIMHHPPPGCAGGNNPARKSFPHLGPFPILRTPFSGALGRGGALRRPVIAAR
jgi:hypothetical protein